MASGPSPLPWIPAFAGMEAVGRAILGLPLLRYPHPRSPGFPLSRE